MTHTLADSAYARYMLYWLETLEWPPMPMADQAMSALVACWRDGQDTDLDAVAEPLWAWVDANKVPAMPTDRAMIRVRMLICLCNASNRELEEVGYFEDLLGSCGVSPSQILRARSSHDLGAGAGAGAGARASESAGNDNGREPRVAALPSPTVGLDASKIAFLQQAKTRVLWAFGMVSFLSGARPIGTGSSQPIETLLIFGMAMLIFFWYRFDSDLRGFQRTPLLNFAMVMVAALAMPYYLIRTRGWPQAQFSIAKAIGVFFGSIVLATIGAILFGNSA
jgi:hypothetical protein